MIITLTQLILPDRRRLPIESLAATPIGGDHRKEVKEVKKVKKEVKEEVKGGRISIRGDGNQKEGVNIPLGGNYARRGHRPGLPPCHL
ncbi:hypothetical protein EYF80_038986 [Liparis tanakae]|uniref:Uncharacterized protein n=1 Tax=Liparis tanakae TaxID=230148 RepID=A0A4Z2GBV4_9TELE|nr:hypothetical protein EYF80_038986 [Liparis tanakae]